MPRPDLSLVPSFFHNYINQVKEDDPLSALLKQTGELISFFEQIPASLHDYAYAEGKWTLKDLLQHMSDCERIFAYRALRIARKDTTPLPGFDEDLYALHARAGKRSWESLVGEFKAVRRSTEILYSGFGEEELACTGTSNDAPISVLAICFITVGHCNHHVRIIRERYLV